jgi:hypothetical protein
VPLSSEAERKLLKHSWPGNVRELRHTIHRAHLMRKGARIEAEDVTFEPSAESVSRALGAEERAPNADDLNRVHFVGKKLEDMVDEIVAKTCRRVGPPGKVAEALGVARTAIFRRLESRGVLPSDIPHEAKNSSPFGAKSRAGWQRLQAPDPGLQEETWAADGLTWGLEPGVWSLGSGSAGLGSRESHRHE